MRNRIILSAPVFVLAIVFSGYVYLSVCAKRALTISEFARFSDTILSSSLVHQSEGGGSRALKLTEEALLSAPSNGVIKFDGRDYTFPLPKYAIRQDEGEGRYYFLAFASSAEMDDYFHRALPEAGWKHVDQMGAGHFLEGHGVRMIITQHFYLTSNISEFNVSIRKRQ